MQKSIRSTVQSPAKIDYGGREHGSGFIYLIRGNNLPGRPIKIGRAKSRNRYKVYSVKAPIECELLNDYFVIEHVEVEAYVHRILDHRRIEGEWFELGSEELNELLEFLHRLEIGRMGGCPDWRWESEDAIENFERNIYFWGFLDNNPQEARQWFELNDDDRLTAARRRQFRVVV